MKLLAALLLCSAALAAAQEVQQVDPASAGASCYQLPTSETPPGTDGWLKCMFSTSGTTTHVCTAICNKPYFTPKPHDPTALCSSGGWAVPTGTCQPTAENCVNTEPPTRSGTKNGWRCTPHVGGDYAKRCVGTCAASHTPLQGEDPAAHCNRYNGKWEFTGRLRSVGWDSSRCRSIDGLYVCSAPCQSEYSPSPSAPISTCSPDTGDWTAVAGSCKKTQQCGPTPPADTNPPQPTPSPSCKTVGTEYICTATCKDGFSGQPTASCETATGQWSPTSGRCRRDNSNKCSRVPPPGTQVPPTRMLATATSYQCAADCKRGYFGTPTISCNPRTGQWGAVAGTCRDGQGGGCTATPVSGSGGPLPTPTGTAAALLCDRDAEEPAAVDESCYMTDEA
ncbi:hypothetical protein COO60DRAFT_1529623 [Scenedesmus sp. NREL 46B-D3]|nr:hypothetical protein COO60DRAFT_1529623 [Scenedesmus sp. NREL 46B-D3]